MEKKRKLSLERKHNLTGWAFLLPAAILIFVFCFYPMIQALMLSFKNGMGDSVRWVGFANYVRILKDKTFLQCLFNTCILFYHTGSSHVDHCPCSCSITEQSEYKGKRNLSNYDFPAMCNITGIVFYDF